MMRRLSFEINDGRQFELEVSLNDTLQEIKVKIERIYGFSTSSQTLSHDGVTISTDAQLHRLLAAPLADGSQIRLDVPADALTVQPPSTSSTNPGSQSLSIPNPTAESNAALPPPPAPDVEQLAQTMAAISRIVLEQPRLKPDDGEILVTLKYDNYHLLKGLRVNQHERASQLRQAAVDQIQKFKIPDSYTFLHNSKPVKENKTFAKQKIGHRTVIEINPPLHTKNCPLLKEIIMDLPKNKQKLTEADPSPSLQQQLPENVDPPAPANAPAPTPTEADDMLLRVTVIHGEEMTTEEVWSGQKVARLRVKLGKKTDFTLPERYSFVYNGNVMNENLSFTEHNVVDGDVIQINVIRCVAQGGVANVEEVI